MARQSPIFVAFNRGEVSPQVLGRTDVEHLRLAAQIQENWQPRVLGPMTLRPGSGHVGSPQNGSKSKMIPFIAQSNDTAVIELTNSVMRVWVDDAVVTRKSVSTVIPKFGQVGWYASRQTGSAALNVNNVGLAIWNLNIGASAAIDCLVTVAAKDIGVEHAVRIVVSNGPIIFRVGSSQGRDDIFLSATLDTGTYSLAFTPQGNFYIEFASAIPPENYSTVRESQPQGYAEIRVTSIAIEAGGPMEIATPWPESLLGPPSLVRFAPSADVIFVAAPGVPQHMIVRYSVTSWSVVLYKPVKGPMNAVPGDSSIKLSVANVVGNTVLTANQPVFSANDIGTLFRLYHWQQYVTQQISFPDTWTDAIRVTGVSTVSVVSGGTVVDENSPDRNFAISIFGTWTGTITLQRSFDGYTTGFNEYATYTANTTGEVLCDSLNNVIVYYRMGVSGNSVSGVPTCELAYQGGGGEGVCHVTGYISPYQLSVEILVPFTSSGGAYDCTSRSGGNRSGIRHPSRSTKDAYGGLVLTAGGDQPRTTIPISISTTRATPATSTSPSGKARSPTSIGCFRSITFSEAAIRR